MDILPSFQYASFSISMLRAVPFHLFVLSLVLAFCGSGGRTESIFTPLSDPAVSFGRRMPDRSDAAFYRSWSDPARDAPRPLGAGHWMLETDRKTRLAYPRLVSLENGASVTSANAALEAMHGRILRTAYQTESDLTGRRFGDLDTGLGAFSVHLSTVKATYLSSRTLSLAAIGEEALGGNGGAALVLGAVVDISSGRIFTINSCHEERRRPFFTFGPLLTICNDRKLEAFRALWREQTGIVQSQVPTVERPPNKLTLEDCRSLAPIYIDNATLFSLYITLAGLAVHNAFAVGAWEGACVTDPKSPFFPIVIPWRAVAPLMNAGPLRDELLGSR